MNRKAPFGFDGKDGALVINEEESRIIKWIYRMLLEYHDNPPDFLIREVMDNSDEKLSHKEAKEKVSFSMVERYVLAELKLRIQQHDNKQGALNEIQDFLEIQLNKELLAAVEKMYKSYREVEYGVSRTSINKYVGKVKPLSESDQKTKPYNSEPIITKEMYESAVEKIKEYTRHISGEDQSNSSRQTDAENMPGQSM